MLKNNEFFSLLSLTLGTAPSVYGVASGYTLTAKNTYQGSTFFDGWIYNASATDPFNFGNVHWANQSVATALNLTYVTPAQTAIIKVDNVTNGVGDTTFGRNSITLKSSATISIGSLVLMDAVHLPYGCSVWPAFWTLDAITQSDEGGEIDIFEGVNAVTQNQYTLHTRPGCSQTNDTSFPTSNSQLISTNCAGTASTGCAFKDTRTQSYGSDFANNGGGVFAMLWDGDGIQSWFFPRSSIPSDITSGSPQPWTWGNPSAAWPFTGNCDSSFFSDQNLIIDINICGSFGVNTFSQTCSGVCTNLVGDPTNYNNAYFEINYIKTFSGAPTTLTIPSLSKSVASSSSTSSPSATGKSSGQRVWSISFGQTVGTVIAILGIGLGMSWLM